jgi:hypothetical protein
MVDQFDVEAALRRHYQDKLAATNGGIIPPLLELPLHQPANYFEFAKRTSNNERFPAGSGEKR